MTSKWLVAVTLLTLAACADDNGGAGSGDDTLPKRGEMSSDPTIVSAVANCSCGGEICSGGEPATSHIRVRVAATDPAGLPNLGNCSGSVNGASDQDSYGGGSAGSDCYLYFATTCAPSQVFTIGLTVSNDMGGVTTASVKLTVSPD